MQQTTWVYRVLVTRRLWWEFIGQELNVGSVYLMKGHLTPNWVGSSGITLGQILAFSFNKHRAACLEETQVSAPDHSPGLIRMNDTRYRHTGNKSASLRTLTKDVSLLGVDWLKVFETSTSICGIFLISSSVEQWHRYSWSQGQSHYLFFSERLKRPEARATEPCSLCWPPPLQCLQRWSQ